MTGRLAGHVALVTGSAQGIGHAMAVRLAADGAAIAVVDLKNGSETVEAIRQAGGTSRSFIADITDAQRLNDLRDEVSETLGTVDILVNNAGIYPSVPFQDLTLDTWRRVFSVNVESVFLATQTFLPGMRQQKWGRVINTVSNSVALQVPNMTHYMASKLAVVGITRGVATEVGADGITVNAVAPSSVRTPGTAHMPKEAFAGLAGMQSIARVQVPEDLAGTVSFVASDDAAFMTGQVLYVDGGMVRSS
ncbi:SDR family NAD(P)-dependent oxidoreductase [Streptomyces mirabilis]|uniref:SDR family NAD(P)-dependent oxidoreductase n=1 Tax=Streptomyces mirabilis TaxID=68239 RepID=UPI0033344108